MTKLSELPPELEAAIEKLDGLVSLSGQDRLTTPALAVLLGRYVAYEAGDAQRVQQGATMVCAILRGAAIDEAGRLYGRRQ
jgi:hypothetical protein